MTGRFTFPDHLGDELLERSYELKIHIVHLGGHVTGSFKLEGSLCASRPHDDSDDEPPPEEIDLDLMHRLIAKFEKSRE